MAEGLLGGVLGNEDEKPESEAPEALASAEAFAAAIAAIASRQDPEVARRTADFLSDQSRLLRTQAQHLEDEHALRLTHLAHQSHLLLGQRLGQAIRLAFQVVIALVVIVIGAGIAVMLHDAFTSHSVVIDAFNAPAELAPRGVTGAVVASAILNELTRLQDASRASDVAEEKRSLSNGWSNDVRVDVPETGVSLGEISRLLRARFGHDLHIGGSLVERGSGGLALTVSGNHLTPKTFVGGPGDLDKLVVSAAQYVYSQFQPALWAYYLEEAGHCPESISFIKSVYAGSDDRRRAFLLDDWATCVTELDPSAASGRVALAMYQEAVALDPDFGQASADEQAELDVLGDEEGAWRVGEALHRRAGAHPSARVKFALGPWYAYTEDHQAELEAMTADAAANGGIGSIDYFTSNTLVIVSDEVALHDPSAARRLLQTVQPNDANAFLSYDVHMARGAVDEEAGNSAEAVTEVDAALSLIRANPLIAANNAGGGAGVCSIAAPIEEAAGHPDQADAALRAGGTHFVDCQRFRGDILDHRGDWAGAQQAYAQAVALAPDLPTGYYSWEWRSPATAISPVPS